MLPIWPSLKILSFGKELRRSDGALLSKSRILGMKPRMVRNSVPGTDTCWRCFPNEIVQE